MKCSKVYNVVDSKGPSSGPGRLQGPAGFWWTGKKENFIHLLTLIVSSQEMIKSV